MRLKTTFFCLFIGAALITDLVMGTSRYPILLIIVCAIVILYESVSPYVYTPS